MKKVLCIGSVTSDVIVSPADSVPAPGTLRAVNSITMHAGGCAANAAVDLAKLGVPVTLCCKLGKDSFGDFVYKTVHQAGVDVAGIVFDERANTTVSVVCLSSSGERSFLYDPGSTALFAEKDIPERLIDESDIVFVAGAMLLSAFDGRPCASVMRKARKNGKYTVMDTAWDFDGRWLPKIAEALPELDLFMPSADEAAMLTGETQPDKIADRLFELGCRNVIIKLGKDGALVCPAGQERKVLPTYRSVRPVDTTGAGDAFCAGFLAGLAQGWDYYRSAAFANAAGTHCIMAVGASTGIKSIEETLEFMKTHNVYD
jgi:sugar/nucleoside kinase (ribokinase family)